MYAPRGCSLEGFLSRPAWSEAQTQIDENHAGAGSINYRVEGRRLQTECKRGCLSGPPLTARCPRPGPAPSPLRSGASKATRCRQGQTAPPAPQAPAWGLSGDPRDTVSNPRGCDRKQRSDGRTGRGAVGWGRGRGEGKGPDGKAGVAGERSGLAGGAPSAPGSEVLWAAGGCAPPPPLPPCWLPVAGVVPALFSQL